MRCHQGGSRGNNLGNGIKVIWRKLNETDCPRQYLKMLSMERALGRLRMLADVYASCISVYYHKDVNFILQKLNDCKNDL